MVRIAYETYEQDSRQGVDGTDIWLSHYGNSIIDLTAVL